MRIVKQIASAIILLISFNGALASSMNDAVLTANLNDFSFSLFRHLEAKSDDNLIVSPFSVASVFALPYLGAKGETATQIKETFHYLLAPEPLNESISLLAKQLMTDGRQGGNTLAIANAMWSQTGLTILPVFQEAVKKYNRSDIQQADFSSDPEAARKTINDWVSKTTHNMLPDFLAADSITSELKLLLINAVYFKGNWSTPFAAAATKPQEFHVLKTAPIMVPMMTQTSNLNYFEDDKWQVVEMPYDGLYLSMIIMLPKVEGQLSRITETLNELTISKRLAKLQASPVQITLPKFKFDTLLDLNDPLQALGMSLPFSHEADFSGISETPLNISKVLQKAMIEVNEQGTKAAAATAVQVNVASVAPPPKEKPIVFLANHPFIFLIRSNNTEAILFIGKVAKP